MIPNILTTFRFALVPIFAYLMLTKESMALAAIVFVISGITDIVDGYIARRYNMISNFGMIYDPFVDKLMQITAVVCLVINEIIPIWLLVFVLVKEIAMITVGGILYVKKIVVRSNKYGKLSTVIFYAGVLTLIVWRNIPSFMLSVVILIMIIPMFVAGIYYAVDIIKNYDEKRVQTKVE